MSEYVVVLSFSTPITVTAEQLPLFFKLKRVDIYQGEVDGFIRWRLIPKGPEKASILEQVKVLQKVVMRDKLVKRKTVFTGMSLDVGVLSEDLTSVVTLTSKCLSEIQKIYPGIELKISSYLCSEDAWHGLSFAAVGAKG